MSVPENIISARYLCKGYRAFFLQAKTVNSNLPQFHIIQSIKYPDLIHFIRFIIQTQQYS